ncbi:hypothetical protein OIDMADRAFT_21886 [Oidiodendron maius Zn]|uniref:Gamma-glutamylcyclotransferase AIG2-like domain-containing protein n=1 Tax=Oidiodendron maius (strain Zn) TaxID=913774 RepID=A0A0C3HVC6_OIDMZ|nr:hypothetical protein OIDMADRAFT_21886 [Oidiodendron maius Zn]
MNSASRISLSVEVAISCPRGEISTTEDQKSSASYNSKKPSLIDYKFMKGEAFVPPSDRINFVGFRPLHIFLYGILMDLVQLQKIILWGQYSALVFNPGNIIHEMAYEVQKESHMEYLKYYETEAYKVKGWNIKLGNGTEVPGETFIYNKDGNLLKKGSFYLKDWQMKQLKKKSWKRDSLGS